MRFVSTAVRRLLATRLSVAPRPLALRHIAWQSVLTLVVTLSACAQMSANAPANAPSAGAAGGPLHAPANAASPRASATAGALPRGGNPAQPAILPPPPSPPRAN